MVWAGHCYRAWDVEKPRRMGRMILTCFANLHESNYQHKQQHHADTARGRDPLRESPFQKICIVCNYGSGEKLQMKMQKMRNAPSHYT